VADADDPGADDLRRSDRLRSEQCYCAVYLYFVLGHSALGRAALTGFQLTGGLAESTKGKMAPLPKRSIIHFKFDLT